MDTSEVHFHLFSIQARCTNKLVGDEATASIFTVLWLLVEPPGDSLKEYSIVVSHTEPIS